MSTALLHRGLVLLLVFTGAVLLGGCGYIDPCREIEASRKASGDGLVDLVVEQRDCGATTSVAVSVFVVPSGADTDQARPIFKADHVEGLEVSWEGPKRLRIRYDQARIFSYTNFWMSRELEDFEYVLTIREQQKGP